MADEKTPLVTDKTDTFHAMTSSTQTNRSRESKTSMNSVETTVSHKSKISEAKTLCWDNIVASVPIHSKAKNGTDRKVVTKNVSGVALAGEVLAIMGGSGAGKTTLMNILAHLDTKGVEKQGTVLVNGKVLTKTQMRSISAYVQQVDIFCGTLTVREQLTYSALLRMGPNFTTKQKMARVEEVLAEMNLIDCQNTVIGIPNRVKGISVGEKKRLSFACEVLTDPSILFCDEPTSGLDAFMAAQVVSALKLMADQGKTIVTVIHQPSSTVFNMFNKVCFMANGKTAYHGPVKEICNFFDGMGNDELRVPESYNPADHFISKLSITGNSKEKDIKQVETITSHFENSDLGKELKEMVNQQKHQNSQMNVVETAKGYQASFFVQFSVLFRRAFLTTLRDPLLLKVRFIQVILTAIIIGIVNFQTPITGPTVQNIEGVLYNTARDMNFLFLFPSINVITSELPVFLREYKGHIYSVESYYLSKSAAELPQYTILPIIYSIIVYFTTGLVISFTKFVAYCIICTLLTFNAVSIAYAGACVFGNEGTAVTYMPILILPMLVFGGFYINFHSIPWYFRWFSYMSWFRYGFEGLEINQWDDLDHIEGCTGMMNSVNQTGYCPGENGPAILNKRGMQGNIWFDGLMLVLFFFIYRFIGLGALMLRARYSK